MELTRRQLRGLFIAIEVNLFIWLAVCGALWAPADADVPVAHYATGGMIFAASIQHWAYYNLHRKV